MFMYVSTSASVEQWCGQSGYDSQLLDFVWTIIKAGS